MSDSVRALGPRYPAARRAWVTCGDEIAAEVERRVLRRAAARLPGDPAAITDKIRETLYREDRRLREATSPASSDADATFFDGIRRELACGSRPHADLLLLIIRHYVDEISGRFSLSAYRVATLGIPLVFEGALRLLRAADGAASAGSPELAAHVVLEGEVDELRRLAALGTIVLAPTHSSNLDSVILGWAIYRLGLPPVAYGAGLNLFSNPVVGVFMRNLGAYTIDRSKTDPLYRDTLKEYSTVLLERGQHSLFFPGGTRSRSGAIETHLKLGLLGTVPAAYRQQPLAGRTLRPVFVVPCVITYPLVLEAATLVQDFLRAEGRWRYVPRRDEFERPESWLGFLRGFASENLSIHVRFGRAMDPVGNPVDRDGRSLDPRGRRIDPWGYFADDRLPPSGEDARSSGVAFDTARDACYTRHIAERLLATYRRDTVVQATHVLAYVVFEELRRGREELDVFRLLTSLQAAPRLPLGLVRQGVARLSASLASQEAAGQLRRSTDLAAAPDAIVRRAAAALESYHRDRSVSIHGSDLVISSAELLLYYRNRLEGFDLPGKPLLAKPVGMGTS